MKKIILLILIILADFLVVNACFAEEATINKSFIFQGDLVKDENKVYFPLKDVENNLSLKFYVKFFEAGVSFIALESIDKIIFLKTVIRNRS